MKNAIKIYILTLLFTALTASCCMAQLNPLQASYFQNRYLLNPAEAGLNEGLDLDLNYRQQWSNFPGAPKNQAFTLGYAATDRVGLGLIVTGDQSGLLKQTRIMGTYAYHLPLNGKDQKLSFGLSLGLNDPYIDVNAVNGDQTDIEIAYYNQLKAYVDGDFGVAYTSNHWTIQGALPNLKATFFGNNDTRINVDRTLFITSASYKFNLNNGVSDLTLEPLAMFRGVKGFNDIVDAGLNLTMNDNGLNFMGLYHTDKSATFGFGIVQKAFDINVSYNIETGSIGTYSPGTFGFGVKLKLLRKK